MLAINERFQQEYQSFTDKIIRITDVSQRERCESLLKQLVAEVQILDRYHRDIIETNSKFSKDQIRTHRSNITSLRQKLYKNLDF